MGRLCLFVLAFAATFAASAAFAGGGAGNVTVVHQGTKLVITGDDLRNDIAITQANPDEFTVTGTGTTVNGGVFETFAGVTGNLDVDLGDNGDALAIVDTAGPVVVGGSVLVKCESEALTELVVLEGVTVGKDLKVDGAKTMRLSVELPVGNEVVGGMQVKAGSEELTISSANLVVGKNLKILGKPASEDVTLDGGEVGGNLQIKTGAPDSTINILGVTLGGKFDPGKVPKDTTRTVGSYSFAN